jgi:uncharacterized protein with FMN-binding domain
MRKVFTAVSIVVAVLVCAPHPVRAQTSAQSDEAAISKTALDYIDGWYEADTTRNYLEEVKFDGQWKIINVLWELKSQQPVAPPERK